jgi:hypothetical protein
MCSVFLSEYENDESTKTITTWQSLIELRPSEFTETKRIIQDYCGDYAQALLAYNKDNIEEDETKLEPDEDWLTHLEAKLTIKEQSPFTEVLQQLQASYQTKGGEVSNPLYNIENLNFLQFYFMPYIFKASFIVA